MGECEKGRVSAVMQTHSDGAGCEAQNILFKWRRSLKNLQNIAEGPVSSTETLLMHSYRDGDVKGKFLEYCNEKLVWVWVNETVGLHSKILVEAANTMFKLWNTAHTSSEHPIDSVFNWSSWISESINFTDQNLQTQIVTTSKVKCLPMPMTEKIK